MNMTKWHQNLSAMKYDGRRYWPKMALGGGLLLIACLVACSAKRTPIPLPAEDAAAGDTWVSPADGMTLVFVSAGPFTMGDDLYVNETPIHTVTLDAFWIDRTEVTNAMFRKFVEATGYQTNAEKGGSAWAFNESTKSWEEVEGADWRHPRGSGSDLSGLDDHPVVQISWEDAAAYCAWAGRRLPTEAEWEKAARGTDRRIYPWGDQEPDDKMVNYADRNLEVDWANKDIDDGYRFTAPVGSYPAGASPYGALDMAGNVWEWVADRYDADYYIISPARNPKGPNKGDKRVLRGGGWNYVTAVLRCAYRLGDLPNVAVDDYGFRCAVSP